MKKVKKYLGRKIRRTFISYDKNEMEDIVEEFNTLKTIQMIKDYDLNDDYKYELIADNLVLYYCDIRKTNNIVSLCDIRNHWAKGIFKYREFFTKEEIKKMLENDYCVAVEGLQEIDLEDLDKLED